MQNWNFTHDFRLMRKTGGKTSIDRRQPFPLRELVPYTRWVWEFYEFPCEFAHVRIPKVATNQTRFPGKTTNYLDVFWKSYFCEHYTEKTWRIYFCWFFNCNAIWQLELRILMYLALTSIYEIHWRHIAQHWIILSCGIYELFLS